MIATDIYVQYRDKKRVHTRMEEDMAVLRVVECLEETHPTPFGRPPDCANRVMAQISGLA